MILGSVPSMPMSVTNIHNMISRMGGSISLFSKVPSLLVPINHFSALLLVSPLSIDSFHHSHYVYPGCGPPGWERVKAAFHVLRASSASESQLELVVWAREQSGLGEAFDPYAELNVVHMNYEGWWENHLRAYMQGLGEPVENFLDDDEEDDEHF
jgi:hypothetical protein